MRLLQGSIRHYPWGTADAIPALLDIPADGRPFAEYWLGAHPLAPAQVDGTRLDEFITDQPAVLGQLNRDAFGDQLPFLLKVLSARHALSLQVHPSRAQAEDGFARENAAGIAVDAPERTYRDPWPKPEMMIATDEFHTLCGFRDPVETALLFDRLGVAAELTSIMGPLTARKGAAALAEVFLDILSLTGERARSVQVVCGAAMAHADDPGEVGDFARTVLELDAVFPGDPGILAALLLNRVVLQPGQAVQIPAGCMHAHLRGTGIEVMANSDNVIRGGLTNKHLDVGELVTVVDFTGTTPGLVHPEAVAPGVVHYPTEHPEFDVWRLELDGTEAALPGDGSARILLSIAGELGLQGAEDALDLVHGQSAFVPADQTQVRVRGTGTAFVASSGLR